MHSYRICSKAALVVLPAFFLLTSAGYADSDIGLKAVGGRLGIVDPEGPYNSTATFGFVVDLGTFAPKLHWEAAATYWRTERRWPYDPPRWWDLSDFAIRSGVKYYFIEDDWKPFVGGGLGFHNYTAYYPYPNDPPYYPGPDDLRVQFYFVGGVAHRFTPQISGSAELQLDFGAIEQTAVQFNLMFHTSR